MGPRKQPISSVCLWFPAWITVLAEKVRVGWFKEAEVRCSAAILSSPNAAFSCSICFLVHSTPTSSENTVPSFWRFFVSGSTSTSPPNLYVFQRGSRLGCLPSYTAGILRPTVRVVFLCYGWAEALFSSDDGEADVTESGHECQSKL